MTLFDDNVQIIQALYRQIVGWPARTGEMDSDGSIVADPSVNGNPNRLWVRVNGNRSAVPAWNIGKKSVNASYSDIPVRVAYNDAGELEIISGDATEADSSLGSAAGTILTTQIINEVARFILTGRNFLPARIRVWIEGTLTVNSEAWVYRDTANDRITWIPTDDNSLDLTSSLPAQVGGIDQKAPCIIALYADATSPALVALVGSSVDIDNDLQLSDYDVIFVPDDHYPLAGVALTTSTTQLTESDFIDVREWLDRGVGTAGAPADATYIVQTPDGDLPNAQNLDILATGLVKNTTSTGVLSIAAAGTDYTSPTGTESLTNKTITSPSGTFTDFGVAGATLLTIATGAVTRTQVYHRIDTQGSASTDDLDTISGGSAGKLLILRAENSARDVVLTNAGNIVTPDGTTSITLGDTHPTVFMIYDGTLSKWIIVSAGSGSGGMTSFTVAGDSGSSQTITDSNTLTLVGGTGIDTVASATDTVTINIDSTVATLTGSQTLTNKTISGPSGTFTDFGVAAATLLTIATGAVTRTQVFHRIDTEGSASTDDLDTINGGSAGKLLIIRAENAARDVVITNAGNIVTPDGVTSITLSSTNPAVFMIYDGTLSKWVVVSAGTSGGGGGSMSSFTVAGDSGSSQTITDSNTLTLVGGTGIDTVASATDTVTFNIDSTVVTLTGSQILTNKTLTTPTIASFTNATHNHQNAAGGGTLDAAAIASGTLSNARVNFASPDPIGGTAPSTGKFTTIQTTGKVGVGIDPVSIDASAAMQISSTTQGLLIPEMSTGQRTAISSPAEGLLVYDTTLHQLFQYQGGSWIAFGVSGAGSLTVSDGATSVAAATTLNVVGATVSGSTPNATITLPSTSKLYLTTIAR